MIRVLQQQLRRRDTLVGQVARFLALTVMSAMVTVGLPIGLHELAGVPERAAVAIGFMAAFALSFLGTRRLVFASDGTWRRDLLVFGLSTAAFRGSEFGVFIGLMQFAGFDYISALLTALVVSSVAKFFWYRHTFKRTAVTT